MGSPPYPQCPHRPHHRRSPTQHPEGSRVGGLIGLSLIINLIIELENEMRNFLNICFGSLFGLESMHGVDPERHGVGTGLPNPVLWSASFPTAVDAGESADGLLQWRSCGWARPGTGVGGALLSSLSISFSSSRTTSWASKLSENNFWPWISSNGVRGSAATNESPSWLSFASLSGPSPRDVNGCQSSVKAHNWTMHAWYSHSNQALLEWIISVYYGNLI